MLYLDLLKEIRNLREIPEFSAKDLALFLQIKERKVLVRNELSVKRISNDLNRLYRMQFVNRRRVARQVSARTGKCNRGFMYIYRLSSQGKKYLEYAQRPFIARKLLESKKKQIVANTDPSCLFGRSLIPGYFDSFSKELAPYAAQFFEQCTTSIPRGVYSRFPPRIDPNLLFLAAKFSKEAADMRNLIALANWGLNELESQRTKTEVDFQKYIERAESRNGLDLVVAARDYFARNRRYQLITLDAEFADKISEFLVGQPIFLVDALEWMIRQLRRRQYLYS